MGLTLARVPLPLGNFRTERLVTLKLHYDGWLALPGGLRQMLGLKTGDRLEAELVDGAIVLKLATGTRAPAEPEKVPFSYGGQAPR